MGIWVGILQNGVVVMHDTNNLQNVWWLQFTNEYEMSSKMLQKCYRL